jgi:GxxExxY protein
MDRNRNAIEAVATGLVHSCVRVHRQLGPGLLESTYQACLEHELRSRGYRVDCELTLPVRYGSINIDAGYRIDMIVESLILVENKAVASLLPVHEAQLITYLKLSGYRLGFLINWNVPLIKDGINRIVHEL